MNRQLLQQAISHLEYLVLNHPDKRKVAEFRKDLEEFQKQFCGSDEVGRGRPRTPRGWQAIDRTRELLHKARVQMKKAERVKDRVEEAMRRYERLREQLEGRRSAARRRIPRAEPEP
ncbi:MAG: hypothetical protein ACR2IF_08500 [Terriglobales bacterium]